MSAPRLTLIAMWIWVATAILAVILGVPGIIGLSTDWSWASPWLFVAAGVTIVAGALLHRRQGRAPTTALVRGSARRSKFHDNDTTADFLLDGPGDDSEFKRNKQRPKGK